MLKDVECMHEGVECMHKCVNCAYDRVISAIIHRDGAALDPKADEFLDVLKKSAAAEIWHKHGSFYDHLHDVISQSSRCYS
jgi:hypothetical protein